MNTLNRFDEAIQKHFPTVMAPVYGELEKVPHDKTRLIVGKDGLYLDTAKTWGMLRKRLWLSPRDIPYGEVLERDTFKKAITGHVMPVLQKSGAIKEAADLARERKEWAGFVVYDSQNGSFSYKRAGIIAESARVRYQIEPLSSTESIVADIHSHHLMPPYFSATDDIDDAGGVKISLVLGDFDGRRFAIEWRYAVEGFFFYSDEGGYVQDEP